MATRKKAAPKAAETVPAEQKQAESLEQMKVSCKGFDALNVRKSPSMAAPVIAELADGTEVMAHPASRGWCRLEDGGYVRSAYLA